MANPFYIVSNNVDCTYLHLNLTKTNLHLLRLNVGNDLHTHSHRGSIQIINSSSNCTFKISLTTAFPDPTKHFRLVLPAIWSIGASKTPNKIPIIIHFCKLLTLIAWNWQLAYFSRCFLCVSANQSGRKRELLFFNRPSFLSIKES